MIEVTQEKNLAAIVEAAVDKHGTHADAFIPILLEINHNYGYIPAEAIRLVRAKLHQPQDDQRAGAHRAWEEQARWVAQPRWVAQLKQAAARLGRAAAPSAA